MVAKGLCGLASFAGFPEPAAHRLAYATKPDGSYRGQARRPARGWAPKILQRPCSRSALELPGIVGGLTAQGRYVDASAAVSTIRFAGFGRLNQKLQTAKLPSIVSERPETVSTSRQKSPPTLPAWSG
jgi:hypothetical protein